MNSHRTFFATCPKGIEPLLAEELSALGATATNPCRGGVSFQGLLALAYRACLWSRTASRILLPLTSFPAPDPETLYSGARAVSWEEHLSPEGTLAVDFTASGSGLNHSQFGAQKVKDAMVDRFREIYGRRPSVDRIQPNLRINCYVLKDMATLSLDLSGDSLHRRGYRQETGLAPLKENLAAALLLKAGWPEIAARGGPLLDPMCGSGTLPVEAAWIAADIAPGLLRQYWGFLGWLKHEHATWTDLLAEAQWRREIGLNKTPPIVGYDRDVRAIRTALINAGRAGVQQLIHFERRELVRVEPPRSKVPGLVIANPPYGERLGEIKELQSLYEQLGDRLKSRFSNWTAAIFTGNPDLGKRMGLRARQINNFYNGPLPCKLLQFSIEPQYFVDREAAEARTKRARMEKALSGGADQFVNRLRKNLRILGRWAQREGISCYRLYDADIPEYAVAVDIYEQWIHVQEYEAPGSVDTERAKQRLDQVMTVLPEVLGVAPGHIFLKVRRRQKGLSQYERQAEQGRFYEVHEGPCRFLVNFTDFLDTGLFLDHRQTRRLIGEMAPGRRFLNLFGYTGAATVYAALNGARSTTTVDMSNTYLAWSQRNLALNGIGGRNHDLARADCLEWLDRNRDHYDLIFLDPPTFSASKRMQETLDIQRDHVELIGKTVQRLDKQGILIFSNNYRRFKLDQEALSGMDVEDITRQTIPKDFERNPRIHNCWRITVPREKP